MGSTRKWDRGGSNNHLSTMISNVMSRVMYDHDGWESRTELNLHANMVVVGKHTAILATTGNTVYVSPFTPYYKDLDKVSIVYEAF